MGWRYQIPMLVNMGLRVVAPDCLGYGRTVSILTETSLNCKRTFANEYLGRAR